MTARGLVSVQAPVVATMSDVTPETLRNEAILAGGMMHKSPITIGKNARGAWCVLVDGCVLSTHGTRDGASVSARQVMEADDWGTHRE